MTIKIFTNNVVNTLSRNSPSIFTGLAIGGVFTTTGLAIKATPSAVRAIHIAEKDYISFYGSDAEMPVFEILKVSIRYYIPTILSAGLTCGLILASHKISSQRNAALWSLYSLSEAALKEYQDKIVERFGEKEQDKILGDIAQDRLNKNPLSKNEIQYTGSGLHLCYDNLSGRYFYSDLETIRKVVNDFNQALMNGDFYKTLNEFYYELSLKGIGLGTNMGWSIDNGLLDIRYSAKIAEGGIPCIVLDYPIYPKNL